MLLLNRTSSAIRIHQMRLMIVFIDFESRWIQMDLWSIRHFPNIIKVLLILRHITKSILLAQQSHSSIVTLTIYLIQIILPLLRQLNWQKLLVGLVIDRPARWPEGLPMVSIYTLVKRLQKGCLVLLFYQKLLIWFYVGHRSTLH